VSRTYSLSNIVVVDGDTIKADIELGLGVSLIQKHIRLADVDTPETHSHNLTEKAAGMAVKTWLANRLLNHSSGEPTIVDPELDKYGRILAVLRSGEVNVCQEMTDKGFARRYEGEAKTPWDMEVLRKIIAESTVVSNG